MEYHKLYCKVNELLCKKFYIFLYYVSHFTLKSCLQVTLKKDMRKRFFTKANAKLLLKILRNCKIQFVYFKSNLPKNANYTHSHIMLSNYSNFSHVPYKNEFHNVQGNASKYFHLAQKEKSITWDGWTCCEKIHTWMQLIVLFLTNSIPY